MAIRNITLSNCDKWDCSVHTPNIVSESERLQIEELIPGFVTTLLASDIDVKWAASRLVRPLRPIWITRDQHLTIPPDFTNVEFTPIICLCASIAGVDVANSMPFGYVQGAADDHELWAKGLTPHLFWKHRLQLLADREYCDERVTKLIAKEASKSTIENNDGGFAFIRDTGLAVGGRTSGRPPECWSKFDAIINCGAPEYEPNKNPALKTQYLFLPIPEGKRGQFALGKSIPCALDFVYTHLKRGARVLVHCSQGMDRSVGIALAVLTQYFDTNGKFKENPASEITKLSIQNKLLWITTSRAKKHIAVLEALLREEHNKQNACQILKTNGNQKSLGEETISEVVDLTNDTRERSRVLLARCADEIDALLGNNDVGLEHGGLRRSISSLNATLPSQRQPTQQQPLASPKLNGVIETDTTHPASTVGKTTASRDSLNMVSAQVATQSAEFPLINRGTTDIESTHTANGNNSAVTSAPSSQPASRPIRKISERRRRSTQVSAFNESQLKVDEIDGGRPANSDTKSLHSGWSLSRTLAGHMDCVRAVSIRGSLVLSAADDGMAMVWDLSQQRTSRQTRGSSSDTPPTHVLRGHLAAVTSVALDAGYAYAGGLDSSIRVWKLPATPGDAALAFPLRELTGHSDAVWGLTLAEDASLLASVSADATCRLWSVDTRHVATPLRATLTHPRSATPTAACFIAADGLRLAAGDDTGQVLIHDIAAGAVATVLRRRPEDSMRSARVTAVAGPHQSQQHSGSNVIAAAGADGVVQLYDVRSARAVVTPGISAYPKSGVAATGVAFLASTQPVLVTGGSDGIVRWLMKACVL
ncbi:tRNA A64-2'-O-ribosylphosphate transferase [Coemansia sp. RSA 1365]|nr:tRNA A64-2'-O-ribosylphosphate transferase [Coemansia sp. RSA 1365]